MGVTAVIAAGAAFTAYTVANAQDTKSAASEATFEQNKKQDALITQQQQRVDNQESSAQAVASRDQARQRQLATNSSGLGANNTILTSPLGAPNQNSSGGGKTLLGS